MKSTILQKNGFITIPNIYSDREIINLTKILASLDMATPNFRKTKDLFAIRQFLKEVPQIQKFIFTNPLKQLIHENFGKDYFVVKSIYFEKPSASNWFVSYHQDLSISVNKKENIPGYNHWTFKKKQFGVQPPLKILESIYTIRIHLDDTDQNNGALKIIPGSHSKGIYRPETIDWDVEKEITCDVQKGAVMIMKPLLLHSSNRTTNNQKRRVIHLEFSNQKLAQDLHWAERIDVN